MSGETPLTCLKCAAPIARTPGSPGRPPRYCGDACKRLVEYEVRRLDRRIADYALEQRGLKYDGPEWIKSNERERQKRLRALRRWIAEDEARLRALVAGVRGDAQAGPNKQTGAAELEQITDPAELALCAGITRQAAHQRLQKRREPTP